MDETTEVIEAEIVPEDEKDSSLANVAVVGLALVGAANAVRFVGKRLPWTIVRKDQAPETPAVAAPIDVPVAAE